MKQLKNDTLIRALRRQLTPYTPIWLMRQAGRYLPEYNETRKRAGSFLELCKNPHLATEVTLQPITRFKLDAAILFSDILTIPDAMGLGLYFDGDGPKFERPLRQEWEIKNLSAPAPEDELYYVMQAVSEIANALNHEIPLIGFSGSPFTLACYMIEGEGSKDFIHTKTMLYRQPVLLHQILEVNAKAVTDYLNAQIEAGVDAVMLFDTWGGILSDDAYLQFSLRYIEQVIGGLKQKEKIPSIVFTKGGNNWLEQIANTECSAIGLDWTINIGTARKRIGNRVALQGNFDPTILMTTEEAIIKEATRILNDFGDHAGHIFNLGHGILPKTPPENVSLLVETVHKLSNRQPSYQEK